MTTVLRNSVSRVLGPLSAPARGSVWVRGATAVAAVAVAIGLLTVSWDRLGNIAVAGYNVKVPALAFSIGAVAVLPLLPERLRALRPSRPAVLALGCAGAIVLVLLVSSALSEHPTAGFAQLVAVLTGAVAPAIATLGLIRSRAALLRAIGWLLTGAAVASVFGVYQLVAFYAGWPQLIAYTGVGVDGGAGRISAFSYEPAYFANFLILALGAAVAGALLRGRVLGWLPVVAFSVVLVLVNVRALYFLVPALLVLLALRWRQNRRVLFRLVAVGALVLAVDAAATGLVQHATEQAIARPTAPAEVPSAPAPPSLTPPAEPDAGTAADSPTNVFNPNEQSSNAPRLALYSAVLEATSGHPILGVGPGNLRFALAENGYTPPNQGSQVVANNIWLQAFADGGIVLVLLELGLVVAMVLLFFRRALAPVQPLIAAWLAVIGVSGMLTSYFFDVKVWVVLGLVLAAIPVLRAEPSIRRARRRAVR